MSESTFRQRALKQVKTDFEATKRRALVIHQLNAQGASRAEIDAALAALEQPDITDLFLAEEEPATEFEGEPLPTDDTVTIVRCVHEGLCPTCGRAATEVRSERIKVDTFKQDSEGWPIYDYLPQWDTRRSSTVECSQGHKATAEPTLNDWTGWRGS